MTLYRPDWSDGQRHEYIDYDVPESLRAANDGYAFRAWSPRALWRANVISYFLLYADVTELPDWREQFLVDFLWRNRWSPA